MTFLDFLMRIRLGRMSGRMRWKERSANAENENIQSGSIESGNVERENVEMENLESDSDWDANELENGKNVTVLTTTRSGRVALNWRASEYLL